MTPVVYLIIIGTLIAIAGWKMATETDFVKPTALALVFGWWWVNVFIAIYEVYIVAKRDTFPTDWCPLDFWAEPVGPGFWKKAWMEYTCQSDRRYLEGGKNAVFLVEFGNVVWVVLLGMALWSRNLYAIIAVLGLQAYHCVVYFGGLFHAYDKNIVWANPVKTVGYLGISALWIIIPLLCIRQLWTRAAFKGAML